jgi:hypothetical protein
MCHIPGLRVLTPSVHQVCSQILRLVVLPCRVAGRTVHGDLLCMFGQIWTAVEIDVFSTVVQTYLLRPAARLCPSLRPLALSVEHVCFHILGLVWSVRVGCVPAQSVGQPLLCVFY